MLTYRGRLVLSSRWNALVQIGRRNTSALDMLEKLPAANAGQYARPISVQCD